MLGYDPCDGWPCFWPTHATRGYAADRRDPLSVEGFVPRELPREIAPAFATLLPFVRTDWSHWSHSADWTLESGPDVAPSSIDIVVPYSYSPGSGPSWTNYGGDPGDPAEVEIGTPWYVQDGARCEVNLTAAECERVETWIHENPPEPDYGDDW